MQVLHKPSDVQGTVLKWRPSDTIAFVPTMGCLHEGHLKLIDEAKRRSKKCVVSIFVNPLQFGPNEDFEKYPRPFEQDQLKCEARGVDLLFHPQVSDLYPEGFASRVSVGGSLGKHLCAKSRPGHFEGVTTVVLKLLQITQPSLAVFGQKDFQQLRIIEKMVSDLNLPVQIAAHPIVREADGLALSSRNRYLSFDQRDQAALIPRALRHVRDWARNNPKGKVSEALAQGAATLATGLLMIEYLEIASETDLIPMNSDKTLAEITLPRLFVAVRAGTTRLIDNLALHEGVR